MVPPRKERASSQDADLGALSERAPVPRAWKLAPFVLRWRQFFSELIGYGLASAAALAVDVAILKTLVDIVHWHYLPASTVAFTAGAAVAYVLSSRFVFHYERARSDLIEFLYFAALGVVGLLVNALVLSIAISVMGIGLLTSKAIAAACTFLTNFVLRRKLIFVS